MSESKETATQEPTPYSLSAEDFAQPPDSIEQFRLGDKVTRDNFASFLIQSFAVSRGRPPIQKVFFILAEKMDGFDHMATLKSLQKSGGWHALSEVEQKVFRDAFDKVQKHKKGRPESQTEEDIFKEIEKLAQNPETINEVERFFDLERIDSMAEFNACAARYFARVEEIRRRHLEKDGFHIEQPPSGNQHI